MSSDVATLLICEGVARTTVKTGDWGLKDRNGQYGGIPNHQQIDEVFYFIFMKVPIWDGSSKTLGSFLICPVSNNKQYNMYDIKDKKERNEVYIDVTILEKLK